MQRLLSEPPLHFIAAACAIGALASYWLIDRLAGI